MHGGEWEAVGFFLFHDSGFSPPFSMLLFLTSRRSRRALR